MIRLQSILKSIIFHGPDAADLSQELCEDVYQQYCRTESSPRVKPKNTPADSCFKSRAIILRQTAPSPPPPQNTFDGSTNLQQQGPTTPTKTNLHGMVHGVRGFQRGDKPFGARQQLESLQGLHVRDGGVLRSPAVLQPGVLGPHPGVVQAGRDGVGLRDLTVFVLREAEEGGRLVLFVAASFRVWL